LSILVAIIIPVLIFIHVIFYLILLRIRIMRAETNLEENKSIWGDFFSLSPTGILSLGPDGIIKEINPAAERILGLNSERTKGVSISNIFRDDSYFEEYFSHPGIESSGSGDLEYNHPRGEVRTLSIKCVPLKKDSGHLVTCQDISEIRKYQQQKDLRRRELQTIINLIPTMIYIKDARGNFLMVNQSCADSMGYSVDEIVGRNHRDLHDYPDEVEMMLSTDRKVLISGEKVHVGEEVVTSKTGRNIFIDTVKMPFFPENTGEMAILGITWDITEKVFLQKELQKNESLKSLGVLAGGIAHDFNNQLMGILGYLELLSLEPQSEKGLEYLKGIRTASSKSADLVRDLLSFSREYHQQNHSLNIHDVLDDAIKVVQSSGDFSTPIQCHFHSQVKHVIGDANLLQNAFQNLIRNAGESMGSPGHIEVSTEDLKGEELAEIFGSVGEDSYLLIAVKDNGVGMSEEVQTHIFEPFFTTKPDNAGSGMGLAAVYGTVKSHRGYIDVQSSPGKGSLFRIYLPSEIHASPNGDL